MILCKRPVRRITGEIHAQTLQPFVIRLDAGGHSVSIKIKGRRTWYTVTIKQIWTMGGWNAAAILKARRKAEREERKRQRMM